MVWGVWGWWGGGGGGGVGGGGGGGRLYAGRLRAVFVFAFFFSLFLSVPGRPRPDPVKSRLSGDCEDRSFSWFLQARVSLCRHLLRRPPSSVRFFHAHSSWRAQPPRRSRSSSSSCSSLMSAEDVVRTCPAVLLPAFFHVPLAVSRLVRELVRCLVPSLLRLLSLVPTSTRSHPSSCCCALACPVQLHLLPFRSLLPSRPLVLRPARSTLSLAVPSPVPLVPFTGVYPRVLLLLRHCAPACPALHLPAFAPAALLSPSVCLFAPRLFRDYAPSPSVPLLQSSARFLVLTQTPCLCALSLL